MFKLHVLSLSCALAFFSAALPTPANATTYNYVGASYVVNDDPARFGTNMTGSVTFSVDTSAYSGVIGNASGLITSLTITSGIYTLSHPTFYLNSLFGFVSGQIQAWTIFGNPNTLGNIGDPIALLVLKTIAESANEYQSVRDLARITARKMESK